jgi:MerR family transcriptional regulator, light-induced transcriptional regulator
MLIAYRMPTPPRCPIAAVARLTGLTLDTIRAWERRYGAVSPERGPRGRVYSDVQVQRLRLLAALVAQGHTIGQVATLPRPALEQLLERTPPTPAPPSRPAVTPHAVESIVEALERFDHATVDREVTRLSALYPPRDFVYEVVLPLMKAVGERWHDGRLSIAQEHLVSAVMHGVMSTLVRLHAAPAGSPRLLFACPAGETHEFGLLASAMLTAAAGIGVVYLGPNLPTGEIAKAALDARVIGVVLAVTGRSPAVLDELPAVREALAPSIELWVGGLSPSDIEGGGGSRRRVVSIGSLDEFERHLKRLGGR